MHAINSNNSYCPHILGSELRQLIENGAVAQLVTLEARDIAYIPSIVPVIIQQVVNNHTLFQERQGMPTKREFDHQILMILGAVPI